MEQLVAVARPAPELIAEAGRYADRVSVNVELPRQEALDALAHPLPDRYSG